MSIDTSPPSVAGSGGTKPPLLSDRGGRSAIVGLLGPRKIGAIYLWIVIIIAFCIASPHSFARWVTITNILNQYSISGLMALAVVIPLSAALFDLSVGYTMGFTGTVVAWFLAHGMSVPEAVLLSLLLGVFVGLVNGIIVVYAGIDSLIATLGTGSIIGAITTGVSQVTIVPSANVAGTFTRYIATASIFKITLPVFYMIVVMFIIGIVLEQTVVGRLWYAVGFDLEVTRLAGVRVRALRVSALVISALIASIAGIALTARIGTSSPGVGPPYLLPAFSAVFLGATQFRDGRFNAWGAVVATLLLGTGEFGLDVVGAPIWAPDVFVGVALIVSVALTEITRRRAGAGAWTGMPSFLRRYFPKGKTPAPTA